MTPHHRRLLPQPSLAARRMTGQRGCALLVIDDRIPVEHQPVQATLQSLERFSALMAAQGWPAHVSRLAYDRIYAGERFGFARRAGRGELPGLAEQLIQCWRASRKDADED